MKSNKTIEQTIEQIAEEIEISFGTETIDAQPSAERLVNETRSYLLEMNQELKTYRSSQRLQAYE